MRWIKRILIGLVALIIFAAIAIYAWLNSSAPQYDGELNIEGLHHEVEVFFDDNGIPHIYAQDKHDLYLAFGYVHAQDRLFQMELLRRAGGGRLAEIFGKELIKVDAMFRTLGLSEYADESVKLLEQHRGDSLYSDVQAYLEGINLFVTTGDTPPEFSIIGIPKEPFTPRDIFLITGAMAFSFSQGQKTDFILDDIKNRFGDSYLRDLGVWHGEKESFIPSFDSRNEKQDSLYPTLGGITGRGMSELFPEKSFSTVSNFIQHDSLVQMNETDMHMQSPLPQTRVAGLNQQGVLVQKQENFNSPDNQSIYIAKTMTQIEALLPFAPLQGSNSWVVGGDKTESGEVIFCNDTHIGYLVPQTWYEAHLNCPDFEIYGHFMAGVPFALIGRNRELSWGVTMLLNDDMDFYREKINPANQNQVWENDHWQDAELKQHIIKVKGEADTVLNVRITRHGPIVNDAFDGMQSLEPISMFWTYTQLPNKTVDAFYGMNNSHNMAEFEKNLPLIHAPGLSLNYGDKQGNIAWWACASLIHRSDSANSLTILDGASGKDEHLEYFPFEKNPRTINPPWGYIYSANDWPAPIDAQWQAGYFKPQYRADRINELLKSNNKWTQESMKSVMNDHVNEMDSAIFHEMWNTAEKHPAYREYMKDFNNAAARELNDWNGSYDPELCAPTLYNRWLYNTLELALEDEMGKESFNLFLGTHQAQRTLGQLMFNDSSAWWNNVRTFPNADTTSGKTLHPLSEFKEFHSEENDLSIAKLWWVTIMDKIPDARLKENETREDMMFFALVKSIDELQNQFGKDPQIWKWKKACTLEMQHPLGRVGIFRPFFNVGPEEVFGGNETIAASGFKLDSTGTYPIIYGSQMRIIVDFEDVDHGINITPCGQSGHIMSDHYSDQSELYRTLQFREMKMNEGEIRKAQKLLLKTE